jgi:hypothetical protein
MYSTTSFTNSVQLFDESFLGIPNLKNIDNRWFAISFIALVKHGIKKVYLDAITVINSTSSQRMS